MLELWVPPVHKELYNEYRNEFRYIDFDGQKLILEHSLVSISKWESKWHKCFLESKDMTEEEVKDYIRCMTVNQGVKPDTYDNLTNANVKAINEYINDSHSATVINQRHTPGAGRKNKDTLTSEVIYSYMVQLEIPWECQKWHINRLLTLINILNIKNQPPKKMSQRELVSRNASLNKARRAASGSMG